MERKVRCHNVERAGCGNPLDGLFGVASTISRILEKSLESHRDRLSRGRLRALPSSDGLR